MNWKKFLESVADHQSFLVFWGMLLLWTQQIPASSTPMAMGGSRHTCRSITCISLWSIVISSTIVGKRTDLFTQLFVIMLFQFITAATGMAALAGIFKAMAAKTTNTIGNFWNLLLKSCTRILLPMSLIVGFILIIEGTPMGFDGKMKLTTLEGNEQLISQGPAAAVIPIKQLGTYGGGYFGVNSSHPLEKPDLPDQYGRVLVDPDSPDGNGLCVGILSEKKKVVLHDFRGYAFCLPRQRRDQHLLRNER